MRMLSLQRLLFLVFIYWLKLAHASLFAIPTISVFTNCDSQNPLTYIGTYAQAHVCQELEKDTYVIFNCAENIVQVYSDKYCSASSKSMVSDLAVCQPYGASGVYYNFSCSSQESTNVIAQYYYEGVNCDRLIFSYWVNQGGCNSAIGFDGNITNNPSVTVNAVSVGYFYNDTTCTTTPIQSDIVVFRQCFSLPNNISFTYDGSLVNPAVFGLLFGSLIITLLIVLIALCWILDGCFFCFPESQSVDYELGVSDYTPPSRRTFRFRKKSKFNQQ